MPIAEQRVHDRPVGFTLLIRQTDAQSVLDTLTRVTDGRIETLLEEESYRAWDSESK